MDGPASTQGHLADRFDAGHDNYTLIKRVAQILEHVVLMPIIEANENFSARSPKKNPPANKRR
jgi:hypothetical protein